mgnify:FL=1
MFNVLCIIIFTSFILVGISFKKNKAWLGGEYNEKWKNQTAIIGCISIGLYLSLCFGGNSAKIDNLVYGRTIQKKQVNVVVKDIESNVNKDTYAIKVEFNNASYTFYGDEYYLKGVGNVGNEIKATLTTATYDDGYIDYSLSLD